MSSTHYDPDVAPVAAKWLALSEAERVRLAQSHHVSTRAKVKGLKAHAVFHAAVENQIATGYGPTKRAVERLQREGLSRHESLHAVGSVIAQFMGELLHEQTETQRGSYQSRLGTAIEELHAKNWLADNVAANPSSKRPPDGAA